MAGKVKRTTAIITEDLVERVEDYRFENRFKTLMLAVNDLLEKGLEVVEKEKGKAS